MKKPGNTSHEFTSDCTGGTTVRLEPDVAEIFPDAQSVNEALRFLIRIGHEKKQDLSERP